MRYVLTLLLTLPTLAVLTGCGDDPSPRPDGTHVRLLVEFADDSVSVLAASKVPPPRDGEPDTHRINSRTWKDQPHGSHELLFSAYDEDGKELHTTSIHGHPVAIHEQFQPDGRGVGTILRPSHDRRLVDLYLPGNAEHLAVHRTGVRGESDFHHLLDSEADRHLGLDVLGVYPLKPEANRPVALAVPNHVQTAAPTNVTLAPSTPFENSVHEQSTEITNLYHLTLEEYLEKDRAVPHPHGSIVKSYFYPDEKADPEASYNIVILADGFTEEELAEGTFDVHAQALAEAFRHEPGIAEHAYLINFCIVATSSAASGIPDWNEGGVTTSYFHSMKKVPFDDELLADPANVSNETLETFAEPNVSGTLWPELIVNAADSAGVPEHLTDLYLIVANEPMDGMGIAWPNLYTAYVNVPTDESDANYQLFLNTGIHESAHIMGPLADEYAYPPERIKIKIKDLGETYPNLVRRKGEGFGHQDFGDVWWLDHVADEDEVHNGWFKNVQPCFVEDPDELTDSKTTVGLFWPCVYWGCNYFRPSPMCKMRNVKANFCRVCRMVMGESITSVVQPS